VNNTNKSRIGIITIALLTAIPLVIWLTAQPLGSRFSSNAVALISLGQIFGLAGMTLFSINLILAARIDWMEKYFGGMNEVYNRHHLNGQYAFCLLLMHPLFLLISRLMSSLKIALLFIIPGNNLPNTLGIIALLSMMAVMILTLYKKPAYHIWKWIHKMMVVSFTGAVLHILLVQSDISRIAILKTYMLVLAALGLSAGTYRMLVGLGIVKDSVYTVVSVRALNDQVTEITMKPKGKPLKHKAGQFIFISFSGMPEYHPFTISSPPSDDSILLTIKSSGDYTNKLPKLMPGAKAKIEGPFGVFTYANANYKEQIWVAGGIGITPYLSMARALKTDAARESYKIDLYYSVKTEPEFVKLDELKEIESSGKFLRVIPWITEKSGFITFEDIMKLSNGLNNKDIYICGPGAMAGALKSQMKILKVPKENIHSEEFRL
jgi:predicted ferric reductase